jgi:hypothetical protein
MIMRNVRIPPKARWSIFGDTYGGVPSPNTVMVHGYPTRYHGPNFTVPMQSYDYHLRPYARAPFLGFDEPNVPYRWISALMGGAAGMLAAPSKGSQLAYVGIGALTAGLLGPLGVYGIVAAATASKVMSKPLPALELGS